MFQSYILNLEMEKELLILKSLKEILTNTKNNNKKLKFKI